MVDRHELKVIGDLYPADYNPRTISQQASGGLKYSLDMFGNISGIVWNSRTGNLVSGHQRVEQLRALGGQFINGAIQIQNGNRFEVRVVDWSRDKEMTANVTANNSAIEGEYSEDVSRVLDEIKGSIGEVDFDSLLLGSVTVDEIEVPDIDLGNGDIEERESMKKFTVFVPSRNIREVKKAVTKIAEDADGTVVG